MGFSDEFMWGAASAAYQIEGAYKEDGKGLGIWDVFGKEKGRIANNEIADIACNHYYRYKEDVALMKKIGIRYYRFSISWPRILPNGIGEVNEKGLKFYSGLVDELIAAGIEPMVTLYHWDLPYAIHQLGGWKNRKIANWFEEYTEIVVKALSDRVKYWMTINEPQVFIGLGYLVGEHAPFEKCSPKEVVQMSHHVLLAHGKAVRAIRRETKQKCFIGLAPTGRCYEPENNSAKALKKAYSDSFTFSDIYSIFGNSWWMDPVVFGKYPEGAVKLSDKYMPDIQEGDMEIISSPIDFCGINVYQSESYKEKNAGYGSNEFIGCPRTAIGWPVTQDCLYWSSKFYYERYKLPILITENGMAGMDWICLDEKVHDNMRIDFLHRYLKGVKKAIEEGIDIIGYLHWSVMDNFEWAEGFDKRFGLIYVDYITQKRTLKDSAFWYKNTIETNGDLL